MALHLATSATVGCTNLKMVRDDVPPDGQSLIRGQSVLIDALVAELLPVHANLTLRQRDILLRDNDLPDLECEALRKLPLFHKEIFPVDLQALDARITTDRRLINQNLAFEKMAKANTAPAASAAPAPSQTQSKKARQKAAQAQGVTGGGKGPGTPQSNPTAKKAPF
eukprot:GHVR01189343.1.p1 GENE.GHVR01189343.1~~GHVR01189343.1.p1  ORF type:complete len:167 (-),score=17.57 GHVR01189343.1:57-557(-)